MDLESGQAAETLQDFGSGKAGDAARWRAELDLAVSREMKEWWRTCENVRRRFLLERGQRGNRGADEGHVSDSPKQLNILWSNIEVLAPVTYSRPPRPVVKDRWRTGDPVLRLASIVLERACSFQMEVEETDTSLMDVRQDFLLYGRGTSWLRYEPVVEDDELSFERVKVDFVALQDFLHSPARTWNEVRWVARKVYMTREELRRRFGKKVADQVTLDHTVPIENSDRQAETAEMPKDLLQKATVYEIWDKPSRKVWWVSQGSDDPVLDVRDPPHRLGQFFPCPPPAYGTRSTSSLIPVPDYCFYQDQANQIDILTDRMANLTMALRLAGIYAASEKNSIETLLRPENENQLIPVDSWAAMADKGGLKGIIEWLPLDMVSSTLAACQALRAQLIEDVYQITGISDVLRGQGQANETATAQRLKSQFGSLRVQPKQREIQRLARDCVRIMAEIVAERFDIDTLAAMSGLRLPRRAEQMEAQAAIQMAQAYGMEPPPEAAEVLSSPSWEDVQDLLRNDGLRRMTIEVETDSTIEGDMAAEREARLEFIQTFANMLQQALPAIQAAPELAPMMGEVVMFGVRSFEAGRELEETIETTMKQVAEKAAQMPPPGQEQPDPMKEMAAQAQMMRAEAMQQGVQNEQKRLSLDAWRTAKVIAQKNRQLDISEAEALLRSAIQGNMPSA